MLDEIKKIKSGRNELRNFGLTIGIIFFLIPTFQFLTSVFILKETIIQIKVISFIIIWIAIIIFLLDKFKTEYKLNKKNTNESSIQLPN